jgi:hypothetical protein
MRAEYAEVQGPLARIPMFGNHRFPNSILGVGKAFVYGTRGRFCHARFSEQERDKYCADVQDDRNRASRATGRHNHAAGISSTASAAGLTVTTTSTGNCGLDCSELCETVSHFAPAGVVIIGVTVKFSLPTHTFEIFSVWPWDRGVCRP